MSNQSHKDFCCIISILEAIRKIQNYTSNFDNADDFYEDTKTFDAVMMNFVVIGEMADKLSADLIKETKNIIDWTNIVGFRNIIAHNYFGIDKSILLNVCQQLPTINHFYNIFLINNLSPVFAACKIAPMYSSTVSAES